MSNLPATYAQSGVDIEAGNELVQRIKPHAKRTHTAGVLGAIGGFGALFQHDFSQYQEPILVSSTDGVGTKLKIAFELQKHDTIGRDLVAMCVNDLLCLGAKPLFFLDYFATGKLAPDEAEQVIKGIADGCVEAGCALIGGETAELPGFYAAGEYDLAGFTVGVVDKPKIIDGAKVEIGDAIIGLQSSGLHSNGYSLARHVLAPLGYQTFDAKLGTTIGEALLTPTQIYVAALADLIEKIEVKAIANITGGGFYENIPRALPKGMRAQITRGSWPIAPIFEMIRQGGNVEEREMFTTFNMSIGMAIVVAQKDVGSALSELKSHGVAAFQIGEIGESAGDADVVLV